jgi:nitrate/nitrite-specific signal transduction histidine kinase
MIMRERAASVGADLRIESIPGRGTRVIVTLRDHAGDPGERGAGDLDADSMN